VTFREEIIGDCRLILGSSEQVLHGLPTFDAVVSDPPYGIGESAGKAKTRTSGLSSSQRRADSYRKDYGDDDWDDQPISDDLLHMLVEAGKWKIIFGGNYYALPATSCWLVWDKLNGDTDFADCELAWTNLPKAVRRIRYLWNGCMRANRETRGDHPTQKPVGVMSWALQQLPSTVKTVIDPFMGSGTTGVACVRAGLSFVGIEREERYFEAACRRIREEVARPRLFTAPAPETPVQPSFDMGDAA
jgi:site-specific DNA-methyltransferase (adenine-specific)/modification methylase